MVFGDGLINSDIYIYPRLTPVAIGYNSACVRDFCAIFAQIGGFSGMSHRMLPIAFSPTDPRCHGNEIWDTIGYNSAWWRSIVVRTSVLADGLSLSCARLMDGCLTTLWVRRPLSVNQQGQLSLPSFWDRLNE